jgi:hypothetical protein
MLSAFLVSLSFAVLGYDSMPRADDGVANIFQARIFASGRLTAPPSTRPDAFEQFGIIQNPARCSMYPPLYAALLAVGLLLGLPAWVNPFITACTVPLIDKIARSAFSDRTASLTALLFAFSPFVAIVGGSFMNHPLSLFLLAGATKLLLDANQQPRAATLGGLLAGLALLARPYTAVLWSAGLFGALAVHRTPRLWQLIWRFGIGALPGFCLAVWFNQVQTGSMVVTPPVHLYGSEFALGFGQRATGPHTVLRAVSHTTTRIEGLGRVLLGWPVNMALFPLCVWVIRRGHGTLRRTVSFLYLPPAFVLIGYAFYWGLEVTHGPRFLYVSLCTLLPLIANALLVLPRNMATLAGVAREKAIRDTLSGAAVLCVVYAGIVTWPDIIRIYGKHYGSEIDLPVMAESFVPGRRLIFHAPVFENPHYGWAFLMNDLDLKGDLIVARDRGDSTNQVTVELFPGREVLYYRYNWWEQKGIISEKPLPWWVQE